MRRIRVNRTESMGNALRTVQEENDGWLRLFSPAQRKKAYQQSLRDALIAWRQEFLWKRVSAFSVKGPPFNYKLGGNRPMIGPNTGNRKLVNTVGSGRVLVSVPPATRETSPIKISGQVFFPLGHPVPPEISAVFQTIPPDEVRWIARKWQENLTALKSGARSVAKGVNAGRMRLSPEQLAAMKAGKVARAASVGISASRRRQ